MSTKQTAMTMILEEKLAWNTSKTGDQNREILTHILPSLLGLFALGFLLALLDRLLMIPG